MNLFDLSLNTKARVVDICCDKQKIAVLNYLFAIGFAIGATVVVVSRGIIAKTPCAVLIDNNENVVMIRSTEARMIIVKEL